MPDRHGCGQHDTRRRTEVDAAEAVRRIDLEDRDKPAFCMSASTMLDPTFASTARGDAQVENVSHVCDARLDAAIDRAHAVSVGDAPAVWAAAHRRIVDLAAAVPYVNTRLTVFVSKRVGNVTYHPTYSTLLDQMWVR